MTAFAYETWDVFTQTRFAGNPLAIVWDADHLGTHTMQKIAREFNYSETVFLCDSHDPKTTASLRIFTPSVELPFAGHPTIGAALALKAAGKVAGDTCSLQVKAGQVEVAFEETETSTLAHLSPPQTPHVITKLRCPLRDLIGLPGEGQLVLASAGTPFSFLHLKDRVQVDAAAQGPAMARHLRKEGSVGLYLFSEDGEDQLFARLLADEIGLSEDPATGSAAAALVAVLTKEGRAQGEVVIHQGLQMGRASQIFLSWGTDGQCWVGGHACPIMHGNLTLDDTAGHSQKL